MRIPRQAVSRMAAGALAISALAIGTPAIIALAAAIALPTAQAAQVPDFSGTWVLNPKKGENLGMVAAIQETVQITQTSDTLTLDFASTFQGNTSYRQVRYDLNGKSVPNEGPMGDKADTTARWDKGRLIATWTGEGPIAGTRVVRTETRALSPSGDVMTVETIRGDTPPRVLVYEKKNR